MSKNANRYKPAPQRVSGPRRTPYEVGHDMGIKGTLKGLPYGPGASQEAALRGYREARIHVVTMEAA